MVKGDVEEVDKGMLRRKRVNERICRCGRKVADLKIYLFSATKQDRVGPRPGTSPPENSKPPPLQD